MGTLNRGVGLRTMAVALLTGLANFGGGASESLNAAQRGQMLLSSLQWHHKSLQRSTRQSGAAAAKRAKMKRKNIAARQSKRCNYRSSGT